MTYDIRFVTDLLDAEARAMGCHRIVTDTVTGNLPMVSLYESCGFHRVERDAGNFNPPDFDPFLVYFEKSLPQTNG